MAQYVLQKRYFNHFGLDQKSTDLTRPVEFASDILNAQYRSSGAIEKREGYQAHGASQGGHGLFRYDRINPTTSKVVPEILSVSNTLHKLETATITITYSGAEASAYVNIFYDTATSQYRCQIDEGTTQVLDFALGLGFDESTPVTLSDLDTAINAITDFSSSVSGTTSTPAAFLKIVRTHDLVNDGALSVDASYWSNVNNTVSTPFSGSETNKNDSDFENASATQLRNIIYITNGYDEVQKYDGQTVYRAGLPDVSSLTVALVGGGSITGSNYLHQAQYIQKDAVGNLVEGNILTSTSGVLAPSSESFDVTVANVQAGSGFNTNCAIVAGAQVTVNTITVDDGSGGSHTMQAGDTAYFFDSVSGDYVEREVTATAASTITVDGAAVTVADNAVISNNLRIGIYRSKTSGSTPSIFYLVAEIPNDSFSATQVFNDDTLDSALGAQIIEPATDRSAPPKGKYISSFKNQMVIAGNFTNQNAVFYSDVDFPEYFPANSNQFDVTSTGTSSITGIAENNEVFTIFQNRGIHVVSGDIATGDIRVDQVANDIGCIAHATIQEIRGALFFLDERGPRRMTGGQLPEGLGKSVNDQRANASRIDPFIEQAGVIESEAIFSLKRAIGFNDRTGERYWIYLPAETTTSGDVHPNSNSFVIAYNYTKDSWLKWNNLNLAGGIVDLNGELYFSERRYSSFNSSVDHILYRRHNLDDAWDYQDNDQAISMSYKAQWETLGEPSLLKNFLRLRLFSLEKVTNSAPNISVETEHNYQEDFTQSSFSIDFNEAGYGLSGYGTAPYGDPDEPARARKLLSGRIRALRVIFKNEMAQQNPVITGWEMEIATPFAPRIKK